MLLIFIHIFNVLVPVAVSVPTVYDQRQTGNSNIRIDVKDAVLIAIAEEFGDYDYTYDYSDLTIKPEEPSTSSTTLKPESSTVKPITTESSSTESSIIIENSTLTFGSKPETESEQIPLVHNRPNPTVINQDYQIPVIVLHDVKENTKLLPVKIVEKSARPNTTEAILQTRHCSPGFFLDNHNRCKRIRKPLRENAQLQTTSEIGY